MDLKSTAENRVKDFVMKINELTRSQDRYRDKLDNCNRHRQELADKVKLSSMRKENLEKRLKKMRDLTTEIKQTITKITMEREKLNEEIADTISQSTSLKNDLRKITDELCESDIDNSTTSRQLKKAEIMKILKRSFSGVVLFLL